MDIILLIIGAFVIFGFGTVLGFILCTLFRRSSSYVGVMRIIREDEKLVYSLEMYEDPIMLEHVNEIVFKVETSNESSNRK